MAEPIPRARLLQIAQRKLAAMGIPFRVENDEIRGELITGAYGLKNPATGTRIETVRFEIEGHDRMRFLEPASLRDLAPQAYYDQENVGAIVSLVAAALERRHAAAQSMASRMRALGLDVGVDPDRLVAQVRLEVPGQGTAVLEGTERGLVAARLLAAHGSTRPPVSLGGEVIDLREYPDRVDLELYVGNLADRALAATDFPPINAAVAGATGNGGGQGALFASLGEIHAADDSLEGMRFFSSGMEIGPHGSNAMFAAPTPGPAQPVYPPAAAPTLGPPRTRSTPPPMAAATNPALPLDALQKAFGSDARVVGNVEITRELRHAGKALKFVARQEGPSSFTGRLTGPTGVIAELRFDLDRFPGVEQLAAQRLGPSAATPTAPVTIPASGQIWAMDVRVDGEDPSGVRYTMLNAEGMPAGSPKALRRPEFDATFSLAGGRTRLLARVVEVSNGQVGYVQLDPRRQPVGGQRKSSLSTFTGTFRPES